MKQSDITWSRSMFNMMRDGGTWAVPRSGLIYCRKGESLILISRMPWDKAMPITAAQLTTQQEMDIKVIREHFGAAGVDVK